MNETVLTLTEKNYILLLKNIMGFMLVFCFSVMMLINLGVSVSGSEDKFSDLPKQTYSTHRKLLAEGSCTFKDVLVTPRVVTISGRPQNTVQIVNNCPSQCPARDIHVHCGRFAFAGINPEIFKRLSNDDCLVNGGKPLKTGKSINFIWSNHYPLTIQSAKFC